jgi:hypothetical protein
VRILALCLVLCGATPGCSSAGLSSELEAAAGFACVGAIEERLGRMLPDDWQSREVGGDGMRIGAWPPGADPDSAPPDYTCVVVQDEDSPTGVRVTEVVSSARGN